MKKLLKNKYCKEAFKILEIIVGILFMGLAFNSFFYSNNIAPSGFGGLAAVLSDLFHYKLNWFYISPTIIFLCMNAILIFFALKTNGKKYFFYSLAGIGLYALCIEFLKFDLNLNDMFLACIFGSVFMGVGTGLVVRGGGSTGGGEMLGNIVHKLNSNITIGTVIIVVDTLVLALSFATYGLSNSLYTLLAIYLCGKITDFVIDGARNTRAYYIISDKYEEISSAVVTKLYRGATLINGEGVYSKNEKNILLCLINKYEARNLKDIVFEIDENAFLFSTSVTEAYGNGFEKRATKHKKRKIKNVPAEIKKNNDIVIEENKIFVEEDKIDKKEDKTNKKDNTIEKENEIVKKDNKTIEKEQKIDA